MKDRPGGGRNRSPPPPEFFILHRRRREVFPGGGEGIDDVSFKRWCGDFEYARGGVFSSRRAAVSARIQLCVGVNKLRRNVELLNWNSRVPKFFLGRFFFCTFRCVGLTSAQRRQEMAF